MHRRLVIAALVLALPLTALAQDASVLSGSDDIAFARALLADGQPEFAERLLFMVERSSEFTDQSRGPVTAIRLDIAQDRATQIEDLSDRKNALLQVFAAKEKFAADYDGSEAADEVRNLLPDLCHEIGDAITAAIRKENDEKARETLRAEGNVLFEKAELALKTRIAGLKAIENRTETDEYRLMAASYNHPHTLYLHSLLSPAGSKGRIDLCEAALAEFDEFDLDYGGGDNLLPYYAYVDMGLCMKELDRFDEAIKSFEKTIELRECWGPADEKTGVWPIPADFRDIVDLVCYATLQKMIVLREMKKPEDVVKTGRNYFASTQKPFGAPSSMLLAKELGETQIATGDAKGAVATAKSMIDEDPDGFGTALGRELLGAAAK